MTNHCDLYEVCLCVVYMLQTLKFMELQHTRPVHIVLSLSLPTHNHPYHNKQMKFIWSLKSVPAR